MEPDHIAFIAHYGGSFNPVDGRAWQPPTSSSSIPSNNHHPTHNIVQVGSETFFTVGEIQLDGWGVLNDVNNSEPQGPTVPSVYPGLPPTRIAEVISCGETERVSSQTGFEGSDTGCTITPSVDHENRFSEPLASLSNGAITNRRLITSLNQCPEFWKLSLGQLYDWERMVDIQDDSVRIHFNDAVKDAEFDLDQALSQGLTIDPPFQPPVQPVQHLRAPRAIRDDVPPNGLPELSKFQFNKKTADLLDLIFMRSLEELSPFGAIGQKGRVFQQCATFLKTEEGTRKYFHALSSNENSRVLQSRYTQLKTWLSAAEGKSLIASGTQEDDAELRRLIAAVEHEETTGRDLRMASKEKRETHQVRALLAEDCREAFASKRSRRADSAIEEGNSSGRKLKKARTSAPSNGDTFMQEVISITRDMSSANQAALTSQNNQNTRINLLYERELNIAEESAKSLALHRAAELDIQRSKLLSESTQASTSEQKIEALDAKLDANMNSINQSLAVMMKHIVGNPQ